MGALDVVRVDLELRPRVDDRAVPEDQVLVRLLGVGLLRAFADDDAAVERRRGCAPPSRPLYISQLGQWGIAWSSHV